MLCPNNRSERTRRKMYQFKILDFLVKEIDLEYDAHVKQENLEFKPNDVRMVNKESEELLKDLNISTMNMKQKDPVHDSLENFSLTKSIKSNMKVQKNNEVDSRWKDLELSTEEKVKSKFDEFKIL
jgi:hypothetical protein